MEGSLRVLGDVRIESARGETRLHGRQQQLVLAQLVFAPDGVVSTARLTDVVWPDGHSSDHRGGALRGIISKIRRFVRSIDGWDVERVSGGYRLCPAAIRATDVFESAALLADIETVAAAEPGRAATLAARAADLLGSELLPGMDNSWADDQRRRITRQRVSAFRSAARFALESHDHDLAVRTAESAIRIDPLDEEHHYLLVRALLGAGRNSQAMRAADDCAELLQRELGTAASDRMKRLRVDAGRLAVPRPVDVRRLLPTSTKLPFVGRAVELGVLERAWNRATSIGLSVVWVHGAGGVGKTRLVREFLERIPEASVMVGLCSDEAVTPFEPIVNLVKSVSGDVGRDVSLVELLRSRDEQPLSDRSQLSWLRPIGSTIGRLYRLS